MRTITIGDVHGCLDELKALLQQLRFAQGVDRLILLGDLVDRGPDPVGVVHFAREVQADVVMGNHEEKHVRWARHETKKAQLPTYKNPMRPMTEERLAQHQALSDDDRHWLANLPIYLPFQDGPRSWIACHAGVPSNVPVQDQDLKFLLRCRTVDAVTGAYASKDPFDPPPGSVYWAERYRGPESVVYGHIVQPDFAPRVDMPAPDVLCCGIDTGCVFGGALTAAVFTEDGMPTFVSLPARKQYHATMQRDDEH